MPFKQLFRSPNEDGFCCGCTPTPCASCACDPSDVVLWSENVSASRSKCGFQQYEPPDEGDPLRYYLQERTTYDGDGSAAWTAKDCCCSFDQFGECIWVDTFVSQTDTASRGGSETETVDPESCTSAITGTITSAYTIERSPFQLYPECHELCSGGRTYTCNSSRTDGGEWTGTVVNSCNGDSEESEAGGPCADVVGLVMTTTSPTTKEGVNSEWIPNPQMQSNWCEGSEFIESGTLTVTWELLEEFTTEMLVGLVMAELELTGDFGIGAPGASRNLSDNEVSFAAGKAQYEWRFPISEGLLKITWEEVFDPEGPAEPTITERTWSGRMTSGKTSTFTLDVPAEDGTAGIQNVVIVCNEEEEADE